MAYRYTDGTSGEITLYQNSGTSGSFYPSEEQRLLSRPIRVFWMGWETDTLKLQNAGWKIAVKQDIYRDYYTFLFRHDRMELTALSSALQIHQVITDMNQGGQYASQLPPLVIEKVAPNLEIVRHIDYDDHNFFDDFNQIDAKPRISKQHISRLQDSCVFALATGQAEEVVVDRADMTVVEHLQAIKQLQSDEQKRLREKARAKEEGEEPVRGEVVIQLTEYR
ncbi:MAG: hypothetical protein QNJ81_02530 [Acidimicrobiia bacterium]|nr:hypothetical protein [Acidimicrobiia bacterium]